ncbi:MAG: efflux RND transporter periplasmic adaptor subunit, partial [candidate division KSB1 bacterium]|nr:efflux RND transporter periplasmic adaptor subunit [candidate division KSB1 bacterium]
MTKKKKILIIAGVAVILIAFILANLMKGKGGHIDVQVAEVERGDITQVVSGSGKIKPEVEVKISANVSAEIIGLHVKEGDDVQKGDLLVELDSKRYNAAFERARSTLKSAHASLKKAQSEYRRVQDLFEQNLISMAEKESSEASLLLAESNVEQASASLDQAKDDLSKARIYTPINGTV